MKDKTLKLIIAAAIILGVVMFIVTASFFMMLEYGTSPPEIQISTSIENHEDSWEITIDRIICQEKSLSSITSDRIRLIFKLQEVPSDFDSELYSSWQIYLKDIRDTWSEEYLFHINETTTINMNRIIWNDRNDDGKLSVDDTIVIEKKGGEDWKIMPGDEISIRGSVRMEGFHGENISVISYPSHILPNNESTAYSILMLHQPHESMIHDWHKIRIYDIRG